MRRIEVIGAGLDLQTGNFYLTLLPEGGQEIKVATDSNALNILKDCFSDQEPEAPTESEVEYVHKETENPFFVDDDPVGSI